MGGIKAAADIGIERASESTISFIERVIEE